MTGAIYREIWQVWDAQPWLDLARHADAGTLVFGGLIHAGGGDIRQLWGWDAIGDIPSTLQHVSIEATLQSATVTIDGEDLRVVITASWRVLRRVALVACDDGDTDFARDAAGQLVPVEVQP
jgi:hypothetical protein